MKKIDKKPKVCQKFDRKIEFKRCCFTKILVFSLNLSKSPPTPHPKNLILTRNQVDKKSSFYSIKYYNKNIVNFSGRF